MTNLQVMAAEPDWDQGLPGDVLAKVAGGRNDLKAMRKVCRTWKTGFELSVTKIKLVKTPSLCTPFATGRILTQYFPTVRTVEISKVIFKPELTGDECVRRLVGAHITTLILRMGVLTDAGMAHLAHFPLTSLDLNGCWWITDAGLGFLAGKPLEELDLGGCPGLTPAGIERLRGMPLRRLTLPDFQDFVDGLPPDTLAPLAVMPLTALGFNIPSPPNPDLAHLRGLQLTELNMRGPRLTDDALAFLEGLPLQTLHFKTYFPAGAGLAALRSSPLSSLSLWSVTDVGLSSLRGLPLTSLDIKFSHKEGEITDDGLSALRGMQLTNLSMGGSDLITDSGLAALEGAPLTHLQLRWLRKVTGVGLRALQGAPVSVLGLKDCYSLTDAGTLLPVAKNCAS